MKKTQFKGLTLDNEVLEDLKILQERFDRTRSKVVSMILSKVLKDKDLVESILLNKNEYKTIESESKEK